MTKFQKILSRRDFLRMIGLGAGATALSACGVKPEAVETAISIPVTPGSTAIPSATPIPGPEVALRVAHISDMHMPRRRRGKPGSYTVVQLFSSDPSQHSAFERKSFNLLNKDLFC